MQYGGDEDLTLDEAAERQAAEDRAFEENPYGTGGDPDASTEYDYDAGSVATDIDYQPGDNGLSDEFTSYGDTDAYSRQFGNYNDADEDDEDDADDEYDEDDDDDDDYDDDDDDEDDDYGDWDDNWEEGEEDVVGIGTTLEDAHKNPQKYEHGSVITIGGRQYTVHNIGGHVSLVEDLSGQDDEKKSNKPKVIDWKKGQPITPRMVQRFWPIMREKLDDNYEVRQLMFKVSKKAYAGLQSYTQGQDLLKTLATVHKVKEAFARNRGELKIFVIDEIISILNRMGKRTLVAVGLVAKGFAAHSWTQLGNFINIRQDFELTVEDDVKDELQDLFEVAVPLLNGEAKKQGKEQDKK